ncbi:MAG: N,N-dimethylformamidase beta subunit family domain-containing protein, partial [Nocardioides sp.]
MLGVLTRGRAQIRTAGAVLAVAAALLVVPATTQSALAADDPCGPTGNKIACENSKPGAPKSEWDIQGSGDASIQGFSTDISVNVGQRIDFKINTNASAYTIDIYRTGYYGGDGARKIASVTPSAPLPQTQPQCITDATTEIYDCGNWAVSASWNVPSTAVSGVYIAKLYRADRNDTSHITFIVRDDSSHSDVVFQTSDTTWQAYNNYGGSDFYKGGAHGRAYKISYNRPVTTRDDVPYGRDFYFANEYPLVRFLEKNGYDVSYIAGVDTHRRGNLLTNHKTFLSVGHDEYWSGQQRANVEAARDAGVNLQFLSGNEMYWRVRYEPSVDSSHTSNRTIVCYKETWDNAKTDPAPEWTGTWRDPRFAPRSQGAGRTENGLTGTAYMSNFSDLPLTVTRDEGRMRLWRGTTLATTTAAQTELAPSTVGYESNEDLDNGERPPGLIRLSTTTGAVPQYLTDFGNTVVPGTTTHHMTMYRASSGARVFSAGTVQWTWGLDDEHDGTYPVAPPDKRMQQAQVNLLADMGAQPTTLDSTLTKTTASTDTVGPTTTISTPAAGAAQANGSQVTVTGTATDTGGGRVAGVEASTDGGVTWHAATGRESWSYTFVQHGLGNTPIQVRAMDDSANIGPAVSRGFAVSCPCSIFGAAVPDNPTTDDSSSAELGLRFQPTSDGFITGVRFYKGTGNTGTHVGSLWSAGGQRLGNVTFSGESATGWQVASFATPIAVAAGQTYVVSYSVPNGHYPSQAHAFAARGIDAGPLYVDGGFGAAPAGVYGNAGTFPSASFNNTNYFVDALFTSTDGSPLIAINQWPLPGSSSVPLTTTVSAKFSKPMKPGTPGITVKDSTGATVAGSTSYDTATRTITFTPSAALSGFVKYDVTLAGVDSQDIPITGGKTWSFTTVRPPGAPGV